MKAIILERRGDEAAVLCEDGTFLTRRVSGAVGETVELSAAVTAFPKKKRWMRTAVAAALALTVTGGTLGYMGGTASAYVSLDVEDSAIELTVNHFGRVIAVNAVSEDAESLARSLSAEIRHKPVRDALDRTMTRLRDEGYLAGTEQTVVAGVASDNTRRKAELAQTVTDAVDTQLFAVTESSRAEREQAHEQHMSVGRFGAARDHVELPAAKDDRAEAPDESTPRPSVPVSGAESDIPDDAQPMEPPARETPETDHEPANVPPFDAPRDPREETPAQQGSQPDMQEQPRPQTEGQPDAGESRPSRESGQQPEQEEPRPGEGMQPPQPGIERQEQPEQAHPPQGNERMERQHNKL